MRTLRVLVAGPPATVAAPWTLVDDARRVTERGRGPAASWPDAERREAVLAATAVRVVSLALPPLPPARVEQAARYALEERLATPLDTAIVVTGPQQADGRVVALVLDRGLAQAIAAHTPAFDRVLPEPSMVSVPPVGTWRWCASEGHGFVLTPQGEAFAIAAASGPALPPELRVALEQAARSGRAPDRIVAAVPDAEVQRHAWSRTGGVPFEAAPAWQWMHGEGPDLAPAIAKALAPAVAPPARARLGTALAIAALAVAFHAIATVGTWAWRKLELVRAHAAIVAVAREAGVADATPANAVTALDTRHASARHAAGRFAERDAWPLLARAAPALSALPPGTVRNARFAGTAWTLELGSVDDAALSAFAATLASAGMSAVTARTPSGVRVRIEVPA